MSCATRAKVKPCTECRVGTVANSKEAPLVPDNSRSTLPKFQLFLMVLMKLCLNLGDQYLAYCFNIHNSTVSRNFKKWIDVMYLRLKPLIKWPACDELLLTMPMSFRKINHYRLLWSVHWKTYMQAWNLKHKPGATINNITLSNFSLELPYKELFLSSQRHGVAMFPMSTWRRIVACWTICCWVIW